MQLTTENKDEILVALRSGICNLVYTKMDGELRTATGTLDPKFIPESAKPKGEYQNGVKLEKGLVTYFDLTVNAWRSFYRENLKALSL